MKILKTLIVLIVEMSCVLFSQQTRIDSLQSHLLLLTDKRESAVVLAKLADAYTYVNADSSITYAKRALMEAREAEAPSAQILAHHVLGRTYQTKAQLDLNSYHLLEALRISDSIDNKSLKIKSLELLAVSKEKINNEAAMQYLLQALKISEGIKDKAGTASIFHRIGTLYSIQGKYQDALLHFIKSKEIWDVLAPLNSAGISSEIGNVYYRLKDYRNALSYYDHALDINKQIGDIQGLGYSYNNVGLVLYKLGDKKRSLQALEQALEYRRTVDSREGISNSYVNLAEYYLSEKNFDKALMYAETNLAYVQSSGFLFLLADAYQVLADVHTKRKDFEKAYYHHVRYTELKDSINNAQQLKNLSELQVMYETERKETENAYLRENQAKQEAIIQQQTILFTSSVILFILMTVAVVALFRANKVKTKANALLQQQNDIIEKQKLQLEETNTVKDKLFSVLTHDLRGPVTSLKTFISYVDDPVLTEKEMREYFQLTASTIDNIMALMENVLHWSKNQWKGIVSEPTTINLYVIAKDRIRLLEPQAHQKSITLQNLVPPSADAFADYQMIDIVLRNLLSNAIKFTGHDGVVRIRTIEHDDFIETSVEDTGIGMTKEHIDRVFAAEGISTPGTANERGTGLGLVLCKEFVEKSGGKLWIESETGKGTIVTFSLPRSKPVSKAEKILTR